MINIKCDNCQKSLTVPTWEAKHFLHHFCSKKCYHIWTKTSFLREKHPNWKGGKKIKDNRIFILCREHPRANNGYVAETILIAERILKRPLKYYGKNYSKNEIVHHIDRNTLNNAIDNLFICTKGYHDALHNRMGRCHKNVSRNFSPRNSTPSGTKIKI